jgi:hypothetical protein
MHIGYRRIGYKDYETWQDVPDHELRDALAMKAKDAREDARNSTITAGALYIAAVVIPHLTDVAVWWVVAAAVLATVVMVHAVVSAWCWGEYDILRYAYAIKRAQDAREVNRLWNEALDPSNSPSTINGLDSRRFRGER